MWRAGAAYRFRYHCVRCGLQSKVAATMNEPHMLERYWNEAVQLERARRDET